MREIITGMSIGAALLCGAAQAVPPDFLDTAQGDHLRGVASQDQAEAWQALQPLRERWEGDPGFDLLLGSAAMAVGAWQEAVLALERVEFVAPEIPGVRSNLLRARLQLQQARAGSWEADESVGVDPTVPAETAKSEQREALAVLRQLVAEAAWDEAWAEARRLLAAWEGDAEFDYLLGVTALEQGQVTEAVFALERAMFLAPQRLNVRAQLARAYFLEGNFGRARAEFGQVLAGNPPASVRRSVEGYLRELDRRDDRQRPRLSAQISLAAGFDTNVNAATSGETVNTPVGTFPLAPGGQAQESGYNRVGGRVRLLIPRTQRRAVDVVLAAGLRHNVSQPAFDLDLYSAEIGHTSVGANRRLRLSVRGSTALLDDEVFQWTAGGRLEYRALLDRWRLDANALLMTVRYPDDPLRDVHQLLLAGSAGYLFTDSMASVEIYGGRDDALRSAGDHFGRDFGGVNASLQHVIDGQHLPYVRLAFQHERHHAEHPVFAQRRRDVQTSAVAGWSWFVTEDFTARAELSYTEVDSNIELFDFDRTRLETALLYRF